MPATLDSRRSLYLAPLASFYNKAGETFPEVAFLHGEVMPQPYKHLLVHHSDMTPRLEEFYESPMMLEVLALEVDELKLTREVILRKEDDGSPVEFGAIRIHLDLLPHRVAESIREAKRPLGRILQDFRLDHLSAPRGYFRVKADALMARLLDGPVGETLFGRCNVLALPQGEVFAEIVEILPPFWLPNEEPQT